MIINTQGRPLLRLAEGQGVDDIDFSDIVTAQRTGPARWLDDGVSLEIPMDVEPSPAAADLILRRLTTASANEETLVTRARQALTTNQNFLALTTPTNAQVLEQVRTLTRENSALIRLVMRWLDSTD